MLVKNLQTFSLVSDHPFPTFTHTHKRAFSKHGFECKQSTILFRKEKNHTKYHKFEKPVSWNFFKNQLINH